MRGRSRRRTGAGTACAVALSLVGATCGSDGAATTGSTGDGTGSLAGVFVATGVSEHGRPRPLIDGTTIRLELDGGALSAQAGCNTIGGEYVIDDGVLRVEAMSTTEMGCDPARHAQDEWLAGLLSALPAVELADEGFVLRTDETEITFVDRAIVEPDVALIGTTWTVDGFVDGPGPDDATSSVSDAAVVLFGRDGFVTGHDGCNGFGTAGEVGAAPTDGLRYEIDGETIAFTGAAVSTDIGCPDVDTDRFWAVLTGTVSWQVDGSHLVLRATTGRGVTYTAGD